MKAVIYCRSVNEETNSMENQVAACLEKAKEIGYEVTQSLIFREFGSGLSLERPVLRELRVKVKNCECEAVIIYSLDRLSRNVADALVLYREFSEHGVKLLFANEHTDLAAIDKIIRHYVGNCSI